MATPIDFDGGMYGEPIPDMDFRAKLPRTRWGWNRAMKKLTQSEEQMPKLENFSDLEREAVSHGRKCQDMEKLMLWDEYASARKEWLIFLKGLDLDVQTSLTQIYWAERDRGLTGE